MGVESDQIRHMWNSTGLRLNFEIPHLSPPQTSEKGAILGRDLTRSDPQQLAQVFNVSAVSVGTLTVSALSPSNLSGFRHCLMY